MKDDALDQVVGGVRDRDYAGAGLDSCPLEKRVANSAGGRLQRTLRQRLGAPLGDQSHTQPATKRRHLPGDLIRALPQRVVVMRSHQVTTSLMHGNKKRGGIRTARDCNEDSSGGKLSHGGAGWTRTT